MPRWPVHWPESVRDHYDALAKKYQWPAHVVQGVTDNVEYLRGLTETDRPRRYFRAESQGITWFWEAVEDRGELVALRQVERKDDGVHHYWWGCREDDAGFLTDQALDPQADPLLPIADVEFEQAWDPDRTPDTGLSDPLRAG